jgi:hypothetical protein
MHISYGTNAFVQAENLVIRNCRIFDCWASPLYITAVNGGTFERNIVYNTGDTRFWFGRSGNPQYPPTTVAIGSEAGRGPEYKPAPWSTGFIGGVNIDIQNNVIYGGLRLLGFTFEPSQTWNNVKIRHNTLFGATPGTYSAGSGCLYQGNIGGGTTISNLTIENNIFYDAGGRVVASDPGWNSVTGPFTKRYNLWSHTPPVALQGTGDVVNSSVGMTNVTYVPAGAWPGISTFDTESFKLTGSSVALAAGVTSTVTNDFFGTARPNPPDIGAHERT